MSDQFQQPIFDSSRSSSATKVQTTGSLSSAGWFAIILLIGIVLFFIGQFIYNRFILSPQNIFSRSITALQEVDSGTLALQSDFSLQPSTEAFLSGEAAFPFSADVELAMVSTFNESVTHSEVSLTLPSELVELLSLDSQVLDMEFITVDQEQVYLRLGEVFRTPLFDLRTISNQWISLSVSEFAEQYGVTLNQQDEVQQEQAMSLFAEVYREHPFIDWERLYDAVVGDVDTFYLKGSLDEEVFDLFLAEWNQRITNSNTPLVTMLEDLISTTGAFELWIDQDTYLPVRVAAEIIAQHPDYAARSSIIAELRDANSDVSIALPQRAISIEEAFAAINANLGFGQFGDTAVLTQPEDQNLRALQAALELYFEEHLQYPFPPIGGNILGVHATCLGSGGFGNDVASCGGQTGVQYINRFENNNWRYYLCSEGNFVVEYPGGFLIPGGVPSEVGVIEQTNPLEFCVDSDVDGLPLSFEQRYGSDPENPDTDEDGYYDGEEVRNGYNPAGPGVLE